MVYFLVILVLVLIAVDLLVRFVVDPLIVASNKKNKVSKSFAPGFNSSMRLAGETMYDGGKPQSEESKAVDKNGNSAEDASESAKQ